MEEVLEKIKIKKHEEYKDSGAEWLGTIPHEWHIVKVKTVFRLVVEPAPKNNSFELLSVYTDIGVKPRKELEERGNKASTTDGYLFVKKGDIVVNKLLAWMGAIGVSNYDGVTSPAYDILRAKVKIESNFFHYLFRNEACISELKRHSRGIMDMRLRLYFDKFGDVIIPFPDFEIQKKIVEFLDKKTALIEKAIAIKVQQIELLKERRQLLIHRAVTRGLNPTVKMKHSGVEWIGEIPEHWEVKKLKYCLNGKLKYGANESGAEYDPLLPRYIRITDFGQDGKLSEDGKLSLPWEKAQDYLLKDGDILFARSGATVGKTYQFKKTMSIEANYCFAGYLIKAEANENIVLSDFLYLYTNSNLFNKWKEGVFIKATIENIGADKYSQLRVVLPPVKEQIEILNKFNENDEKFKAAILSKELEIEKLKEYKASLTNSAVTGKIKVS